MLNNKVMTSGDLNKLLREMAKNGTLKDAIKGNEQKPRGKTWLYFAYGSNISITQMQRRCPQAKPMFKATLFNARMEFRKFANVAYEKKKRSFVKGVVYEVTKSDIKALDIYEGFPKFYKKVRCIVEGPYNKLYEAFMYIMQPNVRELELPSKSYLDVISEGYFEWNMSTMPLSKAWEYTAIKLGEIEAFNYNGK
jgi:gamma-glutamylcyclotransferase (GGCT)/AIG2-like uncharacterized protein YtfP